MFVVGCWLFVVCCVSFVFFVPWSLLLNVVSRVLIVGCCLCRC